MSVWNRSKEKSSKKARSNAKHTLGGVVASGGVVVGILAALRSWFGASIPWGVEGDAAIATVITTIIAPLVSGKLTFLKDQARHNPDNQ